MNREIEIVITAVGPDHRGLADPIVHHVTGIGANIAEIQMYDRDEASQFAMLTRVHAPASHLPSLREDMAAIGRDTGLSVRVWSPDFPRSSERPGGKPRLAICTTIRPEPPLALLRAIRDGVVPAGAAVVVGNRPHCRSVAEQFGVPFESIGDEKGRPDDGRLVELLDDYEVDYVILARYMRILPAETCWKFAGGRILNLHHGLLPSFPGMRPYHAAFASNMLTFGATCHFIVPELDAGNQIVHQSTFTVTPGTSREDVIRRGQEDNEPRCLVEGVRRVTSGEVRLHFHRVVATG